MTFQNSGSILIEILLPVFNEGAAIEATVRELYSELAPRVSLRFVICEDGSDDNTKDVLHELSQILPIRLVSSKKRKGYSRALIDGMSVSQAQYVLCLDADGQLDPTDFWRFWDIRNSCDVALGWRLHRADSWMRIFASRAFYHLYQCLYHVPVHDPSCPFVLINRRMIEAILNDMGSMKEGFWWEFIARAYRCGFSIKELPVNHRPRKNGTTHVYKSKDLLRIGFQHFSALFSVWLQTGDAPRRSS
jgi:glycosyltransferase involved in cell wall biosynthesis